MQVVLSGSGYFFPEHEISNEELTKSYNLYATLFNEKNSLEIQAGNIAALQFSDATMIKRVSGIEKRRVINKSGILDIAIMRPIFRARDNSELSLQCEFSIAAATKALSEANVEAKEIDGLLLASTSPERYYPSVAIEVQKALGTNGWAMDVPAACSSGIFAINIAMGLLQNRSSKRILIVIPEIYTSHINFRDRNTHFIFGDGCAAIVLEPLDSQRSTNAFEIISAKMATIFSNEIRNNFSILNRCDVQQAKTIDKFFSQQGRNVRDGVVPLVISHIRGHLSNANLLSTDLKKLWLHQANIFMNERIAQGVLGSSYDISKVPSTLSDHGNIGAAGFIVAFCHSHDNLLSNDLGVLAAFGAGYSMGSAILKKI
jgi:beta-ketodecanoyl-[acyl-carrier-protein] synthase